MAKIVRKNQKIFGSTATAGEIKQFGSLAASAPVSTTDPAVIQALSEWVNGWFSAVLDNNSPAMEDVNAAFYVFAYQLAYLFQQGIAEWETGTTYFIGSFVNSSGVIYVSLTDNNQGNAVTDTTNWKVLNGGVRTTTTTDTATANDDVILADATAGGFTQTLPAVATWKGRKIIIKCINSNGNTVTVKGNGSELIDFANTYPTALASGDSISLYSNGTVAYVI